MTNNFDFIIVGTGPAGISCALPLLETGKSVLFLEGGNGAAVTYLPKDMSHIAYEHPGKYPARRLRLTDITPFEGLSPKLRNAVDPLFLAKYMALNQIESSNFECLGTLAEGGLSSFWGAVTPKFSQDEFKASTVVWSEVENSYRYVAERIGISGSKIDRIAPILGENIPLQPPLPLSPLATFLLDRAATKRDTPTIFGRCRSAVLTEPVQGRSACQLDGSCMSGCQIGAIYNSIDELHQIQHLPNVEIRTNHLVEKIQQKGKNIVATGRNLATGETFDILGQRVVLAAGTLASTRLALDFMNAEDECFSMETTPSVSFGILVPRMFGTKLPETNFGMAQIAFAVPFNNGDPDIAFGTLYDASSFTVPDIAAQSFLTYTGSKRIVSGLLSALAVGLVFLPGKCSKNQVMLTRQGAQRKLRVMGGFSPDFKVRLRSVMKRLRGDLSRLGGYVLPGSVSSNRPGADAHYGATLPMGKITDQYGKLPDTDSVFVVDGSVLPNLPAKHPTFSIMANADRIGRRLAHNLS